jgi:hypothetical protein
MRQQESEPLEEFSQRIYFMALDGFDKGNPEVVDQIATEAFLRGCRDKEAARSVLSSGILGGCGLLLLARVLAYSDQREYS